MKNQKNNRIYIFPILVGVVVLVFGFAFYVDQKQQYTRTNEKSEEVKEQEQAIQEIIESEQFQKRIQQEAERIYYQRMKKQAEERLLELQNKGFTGGKVEGLQSFLEEHDSPLAKHAEQIVKLPRWQEIVAITGTETSFCKRGVGESRNNCGAIRNSETGEFKHYRNKLNAIEDVAILLQKDLYKDKTITQMNGTYCVNEEAGGGNCNGWSERILAFIGDVQEYSYQHLSVDKQ